MIFKKLKTHCNPNIQYLFGSHASVAVRDYPNLMRICQHGQFGLQMRHQILLHNPSAMNVARLFLDSQNQQPTDE
jgi:hypothetical protein